MDTLYIKIIILANQKTCNNIFLYKMQFDQGWIKILGGPDMYFQKFGLPKFQDI